MVRRNRVTGCLLLVLIITTLLTGCNTVCKHKYSDATCTDPKTCASCGKTVEGSELGHDFQEATCYRPMECTRCGYTEGQPRPHSFFNGLCGYCGAEDPDYFVPEKYGFSNNYGMTRWVRITGYSFKSGVGSVTYENYGGGNRPPVYEFKNNVLYIYFYVENDDGTGQYSLYKTKNYGIVNNDCVDIGYGNVTIFERKVINGKLILKVMDDGDECWYVLEDQLDLSRPPEVEGSGYDREYTYYFQ